MFLGRSKFVFELTYKTQHKRVDPTQVQIDDLTAESVWHRIESERGEGRRWAAQPFPKFSWLLSKHAHRVDRVESAVNLLDSNWQARQSSSRSAAEKLSAGHPPLPPLHHHHQLAGGWSSLSLSFHHASLLLHFHRLIVQCASAPDSNLHQSGSHAHFNLSSLVSALHPTVLQPR